MAHGQAAKTHCPAGHPYDEANTILMVVRGPGGIDTGKRKRQCRECKSQSRKTNRDTNTAIRAQQAAE